jgi:hypothetical protein
LRAELAASGHSGGGEIKLHLVEGHVYELSGEDLTVNSSSAHFVLGRRLNSEPPSDQLLISIVSEGRGAVLDGGGISRIFSLGDTDAGSATILTLCNIHLTGGYAGVPGSVTRSSIDNSGGAIRVRGRGCAITLDHCTMWNFRSAQILFIASAPPRAHVGVHTM